MSDRVFINEVSPRDGLQAQPKHLTLAQRQSLIESLAATGVPGIEIGSFVSPKAVPQMAGTAELAANLPENLTSNPTTTSSNSPVNYSALVPNMKGYELALAAGITTHAIVVSATEQMNLKNIGKSLEETHAMAEDILFRAKGDGVTVHVYIGVAFECPYEGKVSPASVIEQVGRVMAHKPGRVMLADTIGATNPATVRNLLDPLVKAFGSEMFACHFHDTRALGLANVYAAIESGVRHFDSSAGGLGGCPFAPGAKGNVATEDVALLCHEMGFETGIDMPALLESVDLLSEFIGAPQGGRSHYWLKDNWQNVFKQTA